MRALTVRQEEVAELVAQGHANREIALRLHLTEKTVKTYVTRIFMRIGVRNRVELARYVWDRMEGPV